MAEYTHGNDQACDYVPGEIISKWQDIVDLVTKIAGTRVGLIMQICSEDLKVCVASNTEGNPYRIGEKEHLQNSGLYCERVIATRSKLLVSNALESDTWNHNPDLRFNHIAYLGFPISKPDGSLFGTICLLDNKENTFSVEIIDLLQKMRDMIEDQLKLQFLMIQNANHLHEINQNKIKLENTYKKLKKNEEKYRLITENTTDYIWVYNSDKDKFTYASPNVSQMRGYTVDEILKQKLEDMTIPDYYESVKEQIREAGSLLKENHELQPMFFNEIIQPCKNGDVIWIEYTAKCRLNTENEMEVVGVSRNIEDRKRKEKEVIYLSTHDYMTGIYNRFYFEKRALEEINKTEHSDKSLSLLILDLDCFKKINDNYGHITGDETLKLVSKIISATISDNDIFAKYGGDEFIILMPDTDVENAAQVAEKIRVALHDNKYLTELKVTVSIGVSERNRGEELDELFKKADKALYSAKENGRDRVAVCDFLTGL